MAIDHSSQEYILFTHYTLRIKRTELEDLKEIARNESVRVNDEVSVARLIRGSLKRIYPYLFVDESYRGPL